MKTGRAEPPIAMKFDPPTPPPGDWTLPPADLLVPPAGEVGELLFIQRIGDCRGRCHTIDILFDFIQHPLCLVEQVYRIAGMILRQFSMRIEEFQ